MPLDASILAGVALAVCLVCIYLVFNWGRQLTLQTHLRDTLVDGVKHLELDRLTHRLDDKAWQGPLDPKNNPFPVAAREIGLSHTIMLWGDDARMSALSFEEYVEGPYDEEMQRIFSSEDLWKANVQIDKKKTAERKIGIEKYREWEEKERQMYDSRRTALESEALGLANESVPKTMDMSVLGGGFSFLLEFSAVIVIIFALVALGILGIMEGSEISTILAAIAGYVLGKATGTLQTKKPAE